MFCFGTASGGTVTARAHDGDVPRASVFTTIVRMPRGGRVGQGV
jgi:hypothetical protein